MRAISKIFKTPWKWSSWVKKLFKNFEIAGIYGPHLDWDCRHICSSTKLLLQAYLVPTLILPRYKSDSVLPGKLAVHCNQDLGDQTSSLWDFVTEILVARDSCSFFIFQATLLILMMILMLIAGGFCFVILIMYYQPQISPQPQNG